MSKRPPEDNPLIEKILKELDVSITDIDLDSKEAMKEALRDSMGLWFPDIGLQPELSILDGAKSDMRTSGINIQQEPETTVGEGAEVVDAAPDPKKLRSQFQLLNDDDSLFDSEDDGLPTVQVRVLSPQDLLGAGHGLFGLSKTTDTGFVAPKTELRRGSIVLESTEKVTLVQRSKAVTYRISCDQGMFEIIMDGNSHVLRGGQSMDVESNSIVLMGHETSIGWYQSI